MFLRRYNFSRGGQSLIIKSLQAGSKRLKCEPGKSYEEWELNASTGEMVEWGLKNMLALLQQFGSCSTFEERL